MRADPTGPSERKAVLYPRSLPPVDRRFEWTPWQPSFEDFDERPAFTVAPQLALPVEAAPDDAVEVMETVEVEPEADLPSDDELTEVVKGPARRSALLAAAVVLAAGLGVWLGHQRPRAVIEKQATVLLQAERPRVPEPRAPEPAPAPPTTPEPAVEPVPQDQEVAPERPPARPAHAKHRPRARPRHAKSSWFVTKAARQVADPE